MNYNYIEEIKSEIDRTQRRRERKKASYDDWQYLCGKIDGLKLALELIKNAKDGE